MAKRQVSVGFYTKHYIRAKLERSFVVNCCFFLTLRLYYSVVLLSLKYAFIICNQMFLLYETFRLTEKALPYAQLPIVSFGTKTVTYNRSSVTVALFVSQNIFLL